MPTFFQLLRHGEERLKPHTDEAALESELLLLDAAGLSKAEFLSKLQEPVADSISLAFETFLSTREKGLPIAYVLKGTYFYGHFYYIENGVFIPRPETELLVDQSADLLTALVEENPQAAVVEFGFGTGILSIELALRFPQLSVYAWDLNPVAYKVARKNAMMRNVSNIKWHLGDFFEAEHIWQLLFSNHSHVLIVSNPPYIPAGDVATLDPIVRNWDPHTALEGGGDGLLFYRRLINRLGIHKPWFAFEVGQGQAADVMALLRDRDYVADQFPDLAGIPRVVTGKMS